MRVPHAAGAQRGAHPVYTPRIDQALEAFRKLQQLRFEGPPSSSVVPTNSRLQTGRRTADVNDGGSGAMSAPGLVVDNQARIDRLEKMLESQSRLERIEEQLGRLMQGVQADAALHGHTEKGGARKTASAPTTPASSRRTRKQPHQRPDWNPDTRYCSPLYAVAVTFSFLSTLFR